MHVSRLQKRRGTQQGLAVSTLVILATIATSSAFACDITGASQDDKWFDYVGGDEVNDVIQGDRYEGECGLVVDAASGSYAVDDNPVDEAFMTVRFWFYVGDGTLTSGDSVMIYQLVGGTTPQLELMVQNNGGNLELVAEARNGTGSDTTSIGFNNNSFPYLGWHVVNLNYTQGAGNGSIAVQLDRGTPQPLTGLNNSFITDAWLGAISSTGSPSGDLKFDSYLSQRSPTNATPTDNLEALLLCDANGDGVVNNGDSLAVYAEVVGTLPGGFNQGTPNCNGDAATNNGDSLAIYGVVTGGLPDPN